MDMSRKPWPIVILATIQFLIPLADMLMGSKILEISIWNYLQHLYQIKEFPDLVEFFGVAPLAGYAILRVQKWSFPAFLGCMLWGVLAHMENWQEYTPNFNYHILLSYYFLNTVVVSFFLLKQVGQVYHNPRLRWWESKPRYTLNEAAQIKIHSHSRGCTLVNISEGGAFVKTVGELKTGSHVAIHFSCLGKPYLLQGEVRFQLANIKNCYGVQFVLPWNKRIQMRKFIRALEAMGVERRPPRTSSWKSFTAWVKSLFFDNTSIVPEVPLAHVTRMEELSRNRTIKKKAHKKAA